MTYIIEPSWIYWIGVANALKIITIIAGVFSLVGFIIGLLQYATIMEYGPDNCDVLTGKRIMKYTLPLVIIFGLAAVFIPSETTLIKMMVMKLATKENIDITVESLKSLADYIVEAIKSVK